MMLACLTLLDPAAVRRPWELPFDPIPEGPRLAG